MSRDNKELEKEFLLITQGYTPLFIEHRDTPDLYLIGIKKLGIPFKTLSKPEEDGREIWVPKDFRDEARDILTRTFFSLEARLNAKK